MLQDWAVGIGHADEERMLDATEAVVDELTPAEEERIARMNNQVFDAMAGLGL